MRHRGSGGRGPRWYVLICAIPNGVQNSISFFAPLLKRDFSTELSLTSPEPGDSSEKDCKFQWLTDWRTDGLTDWRTDGLTDWRTDGLTDWRIDGLICIYVYDFFFLLECLIDLRGSCRMFLFYIKNCVSIVFLPHNSYFLLVFAPHVSLFVICNKRFYWSIFSFVYISNVDI